MEGATPRIDRSGVQANANSEREGTATSDERYDTNKVSSVVDGFMSAFSFVSTLHSLLLIIRTN